MDSVPYTVDSAAYTADSLVYAPHSAAYAVDSGAFGFRFGFRFKGKWRTDGGKGHDGKQFVTASNLVRGKR